MKFLKWREDLWAVDLDKMQLNNFRGGYCDINENADYWINRQLLEYNGWYDALHAHSINPFVVDEYYDDVWISPDGEYYDGNGHSVMAERLVWYFYNPQGLDRRSMEFCCDTDAEDQLIALGWVKASKVFWRLHYTPYMQVSERQYIALQNWCYLHDISIPEDEITIRENGMVVKYD